MDGNTRICKKCLLREMDEAGFFQNMYDYIARIPADDKAHPMKTTDLLCGVLRINAFLSPVRLLDP